MPFLYWLDEKRYIISTQWSKEDEEAFEKEAKEIDRLVDKILDKSLVNLTVLKDEQDNYENHKEFYRDYAVGKSIIDSNILKNTLIQGEGSKSKPAELLVDSGNYEMIVDKGLNIALYTAIGKKASMGISLDFYDEDRWAEIRPSRKGSIKKGEKRSSGKKDIYARAVYLAEQELNLAFLTFGGKVDLVAGAFERNLESLKLRNAIARFCEQYDDEERKNYYRREIRREMYKKLNKIFPSRGPGSSKSPENYTDEELYEMLQSIWTEF